VAKDLAVWVSGKRLGTSAKKSVAPVLAIGSASSLPESSVTGDPLEA